MTTIHTEVGDLNLCPAFLNPSGHVGCVAADMVKKVDALDCAINGVPASPGVERQAGLTEILTSYITEVRESNTRRWKRSDKIAILGILIILLAWPSAQAWSFIVDVYHVTQEWHQLHKSDIDRLPKLSTLTLGLKNF